MSQRTTIDFGIDLGTTNSAIAVLENVTPRIIKNNWDGDVTPSAVGFKKKGQLSVGAAGLNLYVGSEDAHIEFKRQMGTDSICNFKKIGLKKKPEELSAEILKSLSADVERTLGEQIHAAVITVPAAFELHQCNATRNAAQLAGLQNSPLLQEPVAAALAYGFQLDAEKAYWLVYDFGGGTFDAALIKAEDGLINVVHHGGDNFLGGSDIDWKIFEKIIVPKLTENYNLAEFNHENSRWESQIRRLKRAIEIAKIELTTKETVSLTDCVFTDDSGNEVDCDEIVLTRHEVVSVAEPIIRRSIEISKRVLIEKKLSTSGVQKLILVGGPTKAPYFREMLKDLGIPIDHSVDPLTVVAKGAAIFAGTQRIDAKAFRPVQIGEFSIDLKYNPVGAEIDPVIGGTVKTPGGTSVEDFTIEFVNEKSFWRSGKITLDADGKFVLNLRAERGERNTFSIELSDKIGRKQKTIPDNLVYTVGAVIEEQPLINSIGVAKADNTVDWFFRKGGSGLPLVRKWKKSDGFHRTAKPLKAGESGAAITIPIVEGENERADRNRLIGKLTISVSNLRRDLPADSEVELTLKLNESRILTVSAYIPTLDEEFEEKADQRELRKTLASGDTLKKDFAAELKRLSSLQIKARDASDDVNISRLEQLSVSDLAIEIKETLSAVQGDPDAAEKAEKRILEFKLKLDEAEAELLWPTMIVEAKDWLESAEKLAVQHGTHEQREEIADIRNEIEEIISKKETERLEKRQKRIEKVYYSILFSIPAWWVTQFTRLSKKISEMSDKYRAEKLVETGGRYIEQNNTDGLKNVVSQLWNLLPQEAAEEEKRSGFSSGIIR